MREIEGLLETEIAALKANKTYKYETPLESAQGGEVAVGEHPRVMLAANNYLGLADHPEVKRAAREALDRYGNGMASVRFICGTQPLHLELEKAIAEFVGTEDSILFSSCFAANLAFFQAVTNEPLGYGEWQDVLYSDKLNHASIIDGQRLVRRQSTVKRIYDHCDTAELEEMLSEDAEKPYRVRMIVTDGVFSMEGDQAPLETLVDLARRYDALLFVDDCHGHGVVGAGGRGTAEACGVLGEVDVVTGTLGKALSGSVGGFIAGSRVMVEYLRQKARPYTFSNSLPPAVAAAALASIRLLQRDPAPVERLRENTLYFREQIGELGFTTIPGEHPIVPVMLGEASLAMDMSTRLLEEGVYVKGLWFPVVPPGEARLRAQVSAAHTRDQLDRALTAFERVGRELGAI